MSPPLLTLLLFSLLLTTPTSTSAWKKEEFRDCNQTPFCKRARTRPPHSIPSLSVSSLSLSDGAVSARLLPSQPLESPSETPSPTPRALILRLSVYTPGALRLEIDEDYSDPTAPSHRRFRLPDVLLPDIDDRHKLYLPRVSSDSAGVTSFYLPYGFEAVVHHDPFQIQVRRASNKEPILSFNSHGLFDFEQLRTNKSDGEEWEERFRSHTDKRPHGPQSISFDVSFHGADFVYGIPEHASTSLALRPTRGPGIDFSEPYRLFNLDVFEYLHDSPFGLYGSIPFMLSHVRLLMGRAVRGLSGPDSTENVNGPSPIQIGPNTRLDPF